jgi:AraC-like DNA-binding protein/quercetin dioxygenase-like cupin family protein
MAYTYQIPQFTGADFAFHVGAARVEGSFHEHGHDFIELVVITGGSSDHIVNGKRYQIGAGDVYVLNEGAVHAFENARALDLVNVMYTPPLLQMLGDDARSQAGFQALFVISTAAEGEYRCTMRLDGDGLARVRRLLEQMIAEQQGSLPCRGTILRACFVELAALLVRSYGLNQTRIEGPPAALRLADTVGHISEHPAEEHSLDTLAARSGLSRRHFARLFRQCYGTSPMEYVLSRRLDMAARLLVDKKDMSVSAVAYASGFNDSNYFTRQFSRRVGMAPREMRRR